jgi:hypothetical protein
MMNWADVDLNPDDGKLRQFGAISACLLGTLAVWRWWQGRTWIVIAALGVLCMIALIRPRLGRWIYVATAIAAFPMGWCTSRILLAVVFYGVFTPMAILFRIIGRDPLHRRSAMLHWRSKAISNEPSRYLETF